MAKINVGAATESEMKEKKARVEDAMHATRAAIEEGILPGGGVALLRAADGLKPQGPDATTRRSATTSSSAPARPRSTRSPRTPARTATWSSPRSLESKGNYGYDARQDKYGDMVKEGIIDPTKVVRSRPAERRQRRDAAADQRRPGRRDAQGRREEAGGGGHGGYDDMY